MEKILYVEMDVHKESIALAVAADEDVHSIGMISNNVASLDATFCKLSSSGKILVFVYEAGSGGYTLHRHLRPELSEVAYLQVGKRRSHSQENPRELLGQALAYARLEIEVLPRRTRYHAVTNPRITE